LKLKGKVTIVTGASRGLGKAIALGFAKEGAHIVVAARIEAENRELSGTIYQTVQEIKAFGEDALAVRCDVTNEQSDSHLIEETLNEFGKIDVLVNNAGVAFYRPILDTPLKRWELMIKVNLIGPFSVPRQSSPR